MRKGVRNIRNTLRNIMIRRVICFLIRIVWLRRCPILAPISDVRVLAVFVFYKRKMETIFLLRDYTRIIWSW
jgi:hypothetical protein